MLILAVCLCVCTFMHECYATAVDTTSCCPVIYDSDMQDRLLSVTAGFFA